MQNQNVVAIETGSSNLMGLLEAQRAAFQAEPMPDRRARIRRLDKLHNMLLDYREAFAAAIREDFSSPPKAETDLAEIMPLLDGIAYYRKRLGKLMKPQKRHAPLTVMPARVEVRYQPKGIIGVVVPWNFPIFLALSPVIGALAAGNRVMLKGSEFAPCTSEVLQQALAETFAEDEVTMVTGGVDVATEFTQLPFDHLVFTGSTQVGKIVMRAAAENLTPVTLELGGKSPAIIHEDFPIREAASRIAFGKGINAGQVCVSPDYILCPKAKVNEFAKAFSEAMGESYPHLKANDDYTAIITDRQKERLLRNLEDASAKGADLLTINPSSEELDETRKLPMTLVLGATDDMLVMQEEIFGPILPVIPYDTIEEALALVAARPRPLALYYFDWNKSRSDHVLAHSHSGGACVNDTMSHVMSDDIPFGGIGPSGVGHYHGEEGFRAFSHAKGVVRKGRINAAGMIGPPWDNAMFKGLMSFQELRFRRRKIKD